MLGGGSAQLAELGKLIATKAKVAAGVKRIPTCTCRTHIRRSSLHTIRLDNAHAINLLSDVIEHSSHHDTTCCEGWTVSDVIDHAEIVLAMVDNIDGASSISKISD